MPSDMEKADSRRETETLPFRKGADAMDVYQFMQVMGFALTLLLLGITIGKKK